MSPSSPHQHGRFRGLRVDTSASNSQASSSTASPVRDFDRPNRYSLKRKPTLSEAKLYLNKYRLTTTVASCNARDNKENVNVRAAISHTPPIDVPRQTARGSGVGRGDESVSTSEMSTSSQTKSSSVSFSPVVTLDSGRRLATEAPLPKLNRRSRGRSMMKELSQAVPVHKSLRAHSESERSEYDRVTGKHTPNQLHADPSLHRRPTLQQSDRDIALRNESAVVDQETRSPISAAQTFLSPVSATSPYYPTSFETTSAWPNRRIDSGHRARSFNFDARRRTSRAMSGASSTSASPASAFLGGFGKTNSVSRDPDSEGETVGGYLLGKQVGFGATSIVREAKIVETCEVQAVKIVRKLVKDRDELENDQLQAEFEHEVEIWRKLQHKNILSLISVWVTDFATFCFTRMISDGSLFDLIRNNRRGLDQHLVQRYSYQLASAIQYLHEKKQITHRDIKLENCLLDMSGPNALEEGGDVLLCDFGMSEYIDDEAPRNPHQPNDLTDLNRDRANRGSIGPSDASTSIVGSLQYAPPEMLEPQTGVFLPAVDVWAFGVVVFALFVGNLPFHDPFQPRVVIAILGGKWSRDQLAQSKGIAGIEDLAIPLIQGCLDMDADDRLTISQVMDNEWIEEYGRYTARL
ncbi:MAG: hypothetical protein M1814_001041 [Vezdaea aestivalis]|nr:MAG: hypothetical protein M1814_001041 [Vezdaea aestivalis]